MSEKLISVNVFMTPEANELLNRSSKKNYRTKRREAGVRLHDHLKRFGGDWNDKKIS